MVLSVVLCNAKKGDYWTGKQSHHNFRWYWKDWRKSQKTYQVSQSMVKGLEPRISQTWRTNDSIMMFSLWSSVVWNLKQQICPRNWCTFMKSLKNEASILLVRLLLVMHLPVEFFLQLVCAVLCQCTVTIISSHDFII